MLQRLASLLRNRVVATLSVGELVKVRVDAVDKTAHGAGSRLIVVRSVMLSRHCSGGMKRAPLAFFLLC